MISKAKQLLTYLCMRAVKYPGIKFPEFPILESKQQSLFFFTNIHKGINTESAN